jgi:hypothetical protein
MSQGAREVLRIHGRGTSCLHFLGENGLLGSAPLEHELRLQMARASAESDNDLERHIALLLFEHASFQDHGLGNVGGFDDFSFPQDLREEFGFLQLFLELGVKEVGKLGRQLYSFCEREVLDLDRFEARSFVLGF